MRHVHIQSDTFSEGTDSVRVVTGKDLHGDVHGGTGDDHLRHGVMDVIMHESQQGDDLRVSDHDGSPVARRPNALPCGIDGGVAKEGGVR